MISGKEHVPDSTLFEDGWDVVLSHSIKKILKQTISRVLQDTTKARRKILHIDPPTLTDTVEQRKVQQPPVTFDSQVLVGKQERNKEILTFNKNKNVVTAGGKNKTLAPLTLYDFYFVPSTTINEENSAYVLSISDENVSDGSSTNTSSFNDPIEQMVTDNFEHNEHTEHTELDETFESHSDSDAPVYSFQGTPITIELDSSDSDSSDNTTETLDLGEESDNAIMLSQPEQVTEVNLRSGKVLPPRSTSQDKGKQVVDSERTPLSPQHAPSSDMADGGVPRVDYNV
ncbi:hypothetical protein, partial [Klebsiella pneumoniae]|uniref:hypothetical protein n=1 Tax=Klebsiella pneumoniae TaxID=573 RepID=UPI001372483B